MTTPKPDGKKSTLSWKKGMKSPPGGYQRARARIRAAEREQERKDGQTPA